MDVTISNEAELARFVRHRLLPALVTAKAPRCLLLEGPLGAGKTTLARMLIRALADSPDLDVPSPTYTLVQTYMTPQGEVHHYDLYRLQHPDEIVELGWEDSGRGFLTLVEWPGRLGYLAPKNPITLAISPIPGSDEGRSITVTGL